MSKVGSFDIAAFISTYLRGALYIDGVVCGVLVAAAYTPSPKCGQGEGKASFLLSRTVESSRLPKQVTRS